MKIIDIVKLVNTYLAGEHLTYQKMLPYLDATIDDINDKLNSSYPPFSALPYTSDTATTIAYNMFPDKYIRSVVAPGAAHKFYLVDDEGSDNARDLGFKYETNLFYMLRDFVEQVPEYYQSDSKGSVLIREDVEPIIMDCPCKNVMW